MITILKFGQVLLFVLLLVTEIYMKWYKKIDVVLLRYYSLIFLMGSLINFCLLLTDIAALEILLCIFNGVLMGTAFIYYYILRKKKTCAK